MTSRRKAKSARASVPTPAQPATKPVWKKPFVWFIGAIALLLTQINSILSNVRQLPSEWGKTTDQFFNWYGEYGAWKGHWTNYPEGFVDMAELKLSDEDFRLNIDETKNGSLAGSIESKGVCNNAGPMFEELLFDGKISSSGNAEIELFDFIGGYRRNFARLRLKREGYVMTVIPVDDPSRMFAKETRIARDPDEFKGIEDRQSICGGKRTKFITDVLKRVKAHQSSDMEK